MAIDRWRWARTVTLVGRLKILAALASAEPGGAPRLARIMPIRRPVSSATRFAGARPP